MNMKYLVAGTALASLLGQTASAQCCSRDNVVARENSQYVQAAIKTVKLEIEGMTCGQCAASINTALKKVDGVRKIDITFEKKGGTVEYDPAKVTEKTIVEAINKTGFKARQITPQKS
jgi:mercuric ion binding protein